MQLLITCSLNQLKKEAEIKEDLKKWFDENIPDIDYSCICDIDGYMSDSHNWIYETGVIGIGTDEFFNEDGTETLFDDSDEYQIAYLENEIEMFKLYIMLSEMELPEDIEGFCIDDGSQFGYNKKVEIAKLDLEKSEKELSDIRTSFLQ